MSTRTKTTAQHKPSKRLLLLLIVILFAAVVAAMLLFCSGSSDMPVLKLPDRTYFCGMPLEKTEALFEFAYQYNAEILTRTVDGEECVSAYCLSKDWPDSKPNRIGSLGGLRLGDSEEKLLRKYPMASVGGLKLGRRGTDENETWETFTVYYYDGKVFSPEEYNALLESTSESDADMIFVRSHALAVLTVDDEIISIQFGDYSWTRIVRMNMTGTSPYS